MGEKIAFLSDLDGTLVKTTHLYFQAANETCARVGIPFSMDIYLRNRGQTMYQWLASAGILETHADEIVGAYRLRLLGLLEAAEWLPGAQEFVGGLRDAGVSCGRITLARGTSIDVMHRVLGLRKHFHVIMDRESVGELYKPHPHGIHEALRLLGAERGIFLGDEPDDARAGNAAGVPTYHIRGSHTPDHDMTIWTGGIITAYEELLPALGLAKKAA